MLNRYPLISLGGGSYGLTVRVVHVLHRAAAGKKDFSLRLYLIPVRYRMCAKSLDMYTHETRDHCFLTVRYSSTLTRHEAHERHERHGR